MNNLPRRTGDPSGFVPNGVPVNAIDCITVATVGTASGGLSATVTRKAHLADALPREAVAFTAAGKTVTAGTAGICSPFTLKSNAYMPAIVTV